MKTLYLDFEARSRVSLRKTGAYRYAADPSTEVICAGWALVDHRYQLDGVNGGITLWIRDSKVDFDLIVNSAGSGYDDFKHHAADPDVRLVAHNAEFERQVLREKYGIDVPLSRISCTAARAARMSLPRSLEGICVALGLDEEKDVDGHRVLMKLVKPRRPSKEDQSEFWSEERKPADYAKVYDYCIQDVRAMMAVDLQLPELSGEERRLWELTVEMNERGLKVDVELLRKAVEIAKMEKVALGAEFEAMFGCKPNSPLAAQALGLPDTQKATVRDALKRDGMDPKVHRGLELRQKFARTSIDKLQAFLNRVHEDGRVRGSLTYSGAERTQRWSGAGIQPQNFPRGVGKKTDQAFAELRDGVLPLLHDDVLKQLSQMLKGFILGPLLVGDFSTIEPRVLAWLSGEEKLTKLFLEGGDPYCDLAQDIYGRPITKADDKERFMGKQGVLSCGYQSGPDKFRQTLDVMHDTQISEEMAKRVVFTYRRKYPSIVRFWARMESAFCFMLREKMRRIRASPEGRPPIYMGNMTVHGRPFAYVELPSGRSLHYAYPELVDAGGGRQQAQYLGRSPYTHQWEWVTTYGGKLTENFVQATARDLMGHALDQLRDDGFALVLTVHDEAAAEEDLAGELGDFNRVMNTAPAWAAGLPVVAECFRTERYRKG